MDAPLAYFVTFTCRGAWLHGDERGSVDKAHNTPGTPFLPPDAGRHQREGEQVDPYLLDDARRSLALEAIVQIAAKKAWRLWAAHVRSNHVHVVVTGQAPVERMMNDIKTAISRRLNKAYPMECEVVRWTRHGSTRYLWTEKELEDTVVYVVDGQGNPMAVFDGRISSRARDVLAE
jgi:REP element-mobilizing transposase RayT